MKQLPELDSLLHNPLRLAIMSILISVKEADFSYLQKATGSTNGNLSVQLTKLKDAEYISISKSFRDNYPKTTCSVTPKGHIAFEQYVNNLKQYIH